MPRAARLDAPGALHHVIARGIDRQAIFHDDLDRDEFIGRVAVLARSRAFDVFAWALLPNHFHMLLRTGCMPLQQGMRSLLTGHALWFNRRHGRVGHVFQNRYKSIVCEEEPYFLELVRYIHLNPLRAGFVASLDELDTHAYSGHASVMGSVPRDWHQTHFVLQHFGNRDEAAREAYRRFVGQGVSQGRRKDLTGGGLRRSAGRWQATANLRRGREAFTHDERVLGGPLFVETVLQNRVQKAREGITLDDVISMVCRMTGISDEQLFSYSRARAVARTREGIAFLWIGVLRRSGHEVAARLGVSAVSAYRCARRGSGERLAWCGLLDEPKR